jgi:hypothetical protein
MMPALRPLAGSVLTRRGLAVAGGAVSATLAASVAMAADFVPPSGCTAYLAVQTRSCMVSHHYTCSDTPGDLWRMDFDEAGAFYMGVIDSEAQWVESRGLPDGPTSRTLFPARDAASVTTLLETGFDDWDFEEVRGGSRIRVEGFDRLTGEAVVIDGEELLRTEYETQYYAEDGTLIDAMHGREYVSARHRRFFSGVRTWSADGNDQTTDNSPVEFLYPGEPGFASTEPRHNCGPMLSGLTRPEGHA